MAEQGKFGQKPEGLRCEEWEALLVDALDGLLPAVDAAIFRAHSSGCANCADLLSHAEQGRQWLGYLHTEPEVPADLLGRILDRTVGAGGIAIPVAAGAQGSVPVVAALPLRRSFHEARLMMTVAMAFFSIALTLNLVGVKITSLRLADLRPSVIGSTLSRQVYGTWGQMVHYYDNLRFVYQLESRMRELRRDVEAPAAQQQNKQSPTPKNGQSKATDPDSVLRAQAATPVMCAVTTNDQLNTTTLNSAMSRISISLGPCRAGLRQAAQNEGRSLA